MYETMIFFKKKGDRMKKEELTNRMQEGFFELAPDIFDKILEAVEQPEEKEVLHISKGQRKLSDHSLVFKMVRRVAAFIILIGLGVGIFGLKNNESVYVLAMDVNPSIQMELKEDFCVQRIVGLNADGEDLVKKLELEKNSSLEQTVETITDKLVSEGYLKENGGILVTIQRKGEGHEYKKLENALNRELEKGVSKCKIRGVKVAFQATETKPEKTGKEILKEHMIEKYELDQKKIDDMNIRDMIDYVENETEEHEILERVGKSEQIESAQKDSRSDKTTGKERQEIKKKNSDNKEKKDNKSATTEKSKNKQENSTGNQEEKKEQKEQKKVLEEEDKSNQDKSLQVDENQNQEKGKESADANTQEKKPEPDSSREQKKWPAIGDSNNQEKWPKSNQWMNEAKWPQPDRWMSGLNWPVPDDRSNQKKQTEPNDKMNQEKSKGASDRISPR